MYLQSLTMPAAAGRGCRDLAAPPPSPPSFQATPEQRRRDTAALPAPAPSLPTPPPSPPSPSPSQHQHFAGPSHWRGSCRLGTSGRAGRRRGENDRGCVPLLQLSPLSLCCVCVWVNVCKSTLYFVVSVQVANQPKLSAGAARHSAILFGWLVSGAPSAVTTTTTLSLSLPHPGLVS